MALSLRLGENKLEVTRLEVSSTVTLDEVDGLPTVTTAAIEVTGTVDGVDAAKFQEIVDEAAALCPISRLFAGAKIEVTATLAAG
jgi:osmotically inducible protein OsmC